MHCPPRISSVHDHICDAFAAQPATLASPVELAGHPRPEWGATKYFRIRLLAFQDPDQPGKYCASLQGTPEFFGELAEVLGRGGAQEIRKTLQVCVHLPQVARARSMCLVQGEREDSCSIRM
jgi:hypothetical protein